MWLLKIGDFGLPLFPIVLKPGDSTLFEVPFVPDPTKPFAEVDYTRYSAHDRWSHYALSSPYDAVQDFGMRFSSRRNVRWAHCSIPTNFSTPTLDSRVTFAY